MASQDLRVVAAATFIPAFPLLIAEGAVSHHAVPAVGLVPLFFSSGTSLLIMLRIRAHHHRRRKHSHGSHSSSSSSSSSDDEDEEAACDPEHPIIYFVFDTILAAALLIVLVFSWTKSEQLSGKLATLAAYATIPLLINFLIHVYFAVRNLSAGLALYDLTQYFALQIVPAECPQCAHRIRPTSLPRIPWFCQARRIRLLPGTEGVKVPDLERPSWLPGGRRLPEWQAPRWLGGKKRAEEDDHGGMFARRASSDSGGDDHHHRYRDEPDHARAGPSDRVEEPEEVEIAGKFKKKVREGLFHHDEEEVVVAESGPSTAAPAKEPEEADGFKQKVENFLHHEDEPAESSSAPPPLPAKNPEEEAEVHESMKQKMGHLLHHEDEPVVEAPPPAAPAPAPEPEEPEEPESIKQKVDHLLHHDDSDSDKDSHKSR